ncbi:MAG: hypothetical protein AAGF71_12630 [Pseudomonadota bacterium]
MSAEGVELFTAEDGGWARLGRTTFATRNVGTQMAVLRRIAQAHTADKDLKAVLVVPTEQALWKTLRPAQLPKDLSTTNRVIRADLDGATPYDFDDLRYEFRLDGDALHLAVLAIETMQEAERFAGSHGFVPLGIASLGPDTAFEHGAWFGLADEPQMAVGQQVVTLDLFTDPVEDDEDADVPGAEVSPKDIMGAGEPEPEALAEPPEGLDTTGLEEPTLPSPAAMAARMEPRDPQTGASETGEVSTSAGDPEGADVQRPKKKAKFVKPRRRPRVPPVLMLTLALMLVLWAAAVFLPRAAQTGFLAPYWDQVRTVFTGSSRPIEATEVASVPAEQEERPLPFVEPLPPEPDTTPEPALPELVLLPMTWAPTLDTLKAEDQRPPSFALPDIEQELSLAVVRSFVRADVSERPLPIPPGPFPAMPDKDFLLSVIETLDESPPATDPEPQPEPIVDLADETEPAQTAADDLVVEADETTVISLEADIPEQPADPSVEILPGIWLGGADDPLAAFVPPARPADLRDRMERVIYGGRTFEELAALVPPARPRGLAQVAIDRLEVRAAQAAAAEAAARGAEEALAAFVPPRRPDNLAARAEVANKARERATFQTANTAPLGSTAAVVTATTQPAPQRTVAVPDTRPRDAPASVSRQATNDNELNLRRVNLLGTFGQATAKRALVRMPTGRVVDVSVGDRLDGGRVVAIGASELRYVKGGRNVVLAMPRN